MENQVITINNQEFTLKFGYGALRALGMIWKVPGPTQVGNRITEAFKGFDGTESQLGFEQIDVIGAMVYSAVIASDSKAAKAITVDDAAQAVVDNPESMTDVLNAYVAALPQGNVVENKKKPQKKSKKK